jgi:hypothetical protein
MTDTPDVPNSTLSSTLRLWRGTNAHVSAKQPARPLHLHEFEGCPCCRLVREALTELDLDALIYPTPHGGKRFRPKVQALDGKQQFPLLVDPNTGMSTYESADIIEYLYRTYGGRAAPTRLLRPLDVTSSVLASIPRFRSGRQARPSKAPKRPLELFSFESSPCSRRVRELLSELEIPYLLRNTGKARWQDLGPPILRATLFPNLPVEGRNRAALLKRAGKILAPSPIDPNGGAAATCWRRTPGRTQPGTGLRPAAGRRLQCHSAPPRSNHYPASRRRISHTVRRDLDFTPVRSGNCAPESNSRRGRSTRIQAVGDVTGDRRQILRHEAVVVRHFELHPAALRPVDARQCDRHSVADGRGMPAAVERRISCRAIAAPIARRFPGLHRYRNRGSG